MNIAIFVSGSGTNCENLIKYFKGSELVNTALVVSNKPDAYALVRAERLGVPTAVTPKADLHNPDVMLPLLKEYGIEFIVLAGWLPLIPDFLIDAFPHKIINIHHNKGYFTINIITNGFCNSFLNFFSIQKSSHTVRNSHFF